MSSSNLLSVKHLELDTPAGRPLFRDLCLSLRRTDRVAVVGRNGVGKSSLIRVLAGASTPDRGHVVSHGQRILVPQTLPMLAAQGSLSPGEQRRRVLAQARDAQPDLLLLDEPTHDLDRTGIEWLVAWLATWKRGLITVSHDRRVLALFRDFFVVAESGCRHVHGTVDDLLVDLERERVAQEARYQRGLHQLVAKEKRSNAGRQRRMRKKNLGRVREIKRCPARALLNDKRSYAQEKQAKRALLRADRIGAARETAKATRRMLAVDLPLAVTTLRPAVTGGMQGSPIVRLDAVSASVGGRALFGPLSMRLHRDRIAITGPNGAGKSTLVEIISGDRKPSAGRVLVEPARVGYVAQNATNWCDERSVTDHLLDRSRACSVDEAAAILREHRFPLALAQRSLRSLSPGERVRAALICLHQRTPTPELLVLDEPTGHLDFVGTAALETVLRAWTGGLIIISHDDAFLERIGIERHLALDAQPDLPRPAPDP